MTQISRRHYTDAEVDRIISNDILSRDCKRFVYQRTTGRLGWESSVESGKGYSSFLLGKKGLADREMIRTAYGYAQSLLAALDLPRVPRLSFESGESHTNGKTVHVSTKVLDDSSLDVTRRLDVLLGLTLHEGMHVECTDMNKRHRFINNKARGPLEVALENIVEDERIERFAGDKYAGLANYLKETKYYMFECCQKKLQKDGELDGLDDISRLVNAILSIIRYPATLDENDKHQFGDYLVPIHELLSKEFPKDYDGTLSMATKIYDIIEDLVKQKQQQNQQEQKDKQQGGNGGGGEQKGESAQSQGGSSNNDGSQKDAGAGKGNEKQGDGNSSGSQNGAQSQGSSKGGRKGGSGAGGNEPFKDQNGNVMSVQEVMNKLSNAMQDFVKELVQEDVNNEDQSWEVAKLRHLADKYCEGSVEEGVGEMMVHKMTDTPEARNRYEDSLNRVRKYVPSNRNILEATSTARTCVARGLRNGMLDTAKLAEAYQGVPTVYTRRTEEPAKDVCVCVLIDESGSMQGQKERTARDFAVLMNEALGNLDNVDLSIYGYTSGCIMAYREAGMNNRYACGAISSHGGTPTKEAILTAHKRVSEGNDIDCLMFVVSDGEPNGGPGTVRTAVNKVKKEGTSVVGVSIDVDLSEDTLKMMYDNYVVMRDLDSLARDLTAAIKNAVLGRTTK